MLGSQDAYRRIYQTRTRPRFVAALFLQQPDAPRSLTHNLRQIGDSLRSIQQDLPGQDEAGVDTVNQLLRQLEGISLDRHFESPDAPAPARNLDTVLAELLDQLYALHPLLSDHYFSHQARIPSQAELHL
jgi:uncharacterized alpha-E superfamily protein